MAFRTSGEVGRAERKRRMLPRTRRGFKLGYPAVALASLLMVGSADNFYSVPDAAKDSMPLTGPDTTAASLRDRSVEDTGMSRLASFRDRDRVADIITAKPEFGIPHTVLDSYLRAERVIGRTEPGCHLTWPVLAGIGKVESGHANGGDVALSGEVLHPIFGPALDGTNGNAEIADKDGVGGRSNAWVRAVGPMQFLPSTWGKWGTDANGDGRPDPENVYDASLTAGRYLCAFGRDLATPAGLRDAILSYNNSAQYLDIVLQWIRAYQAGGGPVPDEPGANDEANQAHGAEPGPPPYMSPAPAPAQSADRDRASAGPAPAGSAPGRDPGSAPNHDPSNSSPGPRKPDGPASGLLRPPVDVNHLVFESLGTRRAPVPVLPNVTATIPPLPIQLLPQPGTAVVPQIGN